MNKLIICANISDWMLALDSGPLIKRVDLTREQLIIYSLVPQKVDRVGVGFNYASYNATTKFSYFLRWDQFPGVDSYKLNTCGTNVFNISELTFRQIYVLWEMRVKDQMLQVLRNNEIANSFPAIYCGISGEMEITGSIEKMEIIRYMSYGSSGSPLFYRFQPFLGTMFGFFIFIFLFCVS